MAIVNDDNELTAFMAGAAEISNGSPVLIDKYLDNAIEAEVDAIGDGKDLFIGAIMEHIEPAGVHSGDANIVLPPLRMSKEARKTIVEYSEKIASSLATVGLINIQYAVKDNKVYILEANPRASRTVPYVSKAIGVPMVKMAVRVILGEKLKNLKPSPRGKRFAVKSVVFPFLKLAGTDISLGPEMRSTGETMGLGKTFELAYYKALMAAGVSMKQAGNVPVAFLSLRDEDKKMVPELAKVLASLGFEVCGTKGTVEGIPGACPIPKIGQGSPDVLDTIRSRKVGIIINTPRKGGSSSTDGFKIRRAAIEQGIPCLTNINTAFEFLKALKELKDKPLEVRTVEEWIQ
jgi:carbamoyl-phosphate synthase large subunit